MPLYTSPVAYPAVSSVSEGVVATPAGTQVTATQIVSRVNRVTIVATAGDAVRLPPFMTDGMIDVMNDSLNNLSVFAFEVTTQLASFPVGTPVTVLPGKDCRFLGTGTYGRWLAIQSA